MLQRPPLDPGGRWYAICCHSALPPAGGSSVSFGNVPSSLAKHQLGLLPSLEVLPFCEKDHACLLQAQFVAKSSYGAIARDLLTGKIQSGLLPWEVFLYEVFALPGQRDQWQVLAFPAACPTELALHPKTHKALLGRAAKSASHKAQRIVIGVESSHSMTRRQFESWLGASAKDMEISFKFLPVDLTLKALEAGTIDGFVAPSPWGMVAERAECGKQVASFSAGTYAQHLVWVCKRDASPCAKSALHDLTAGLAEARARLSQSASLEAAIQTLTQAGQPVISPEVFKKSAELLLIDAEYCDLSPDESTIREALFRQAALDWLPSRIAASPQTASLLVPE